MDDVFRFNRKELLRLWKQIQNREASSQKSGKPFEHLVLRAFQLDGAEVTLPYTVDGGVEQIDGAVYFNELSCLVESKDYSEDKSGILPIAKLRNQLLRRPSSAIGVVFSRSGFSLPAMSIAEDATPPTVLLWSGDELGYALENRLMCKGLVRKYRYAIEHGLSTFNLRTSKK
jgi:hypothetical protein